jgi:membrane protein YdbS with pleckstrin-like domain
LSEDRLMQILQALALLLFVSVGALSLGRAQYDWVKWARWGSVVIFSLAVVFALILTLRWALDRDF